MATLKSVTLQNDEIAQLRMACQSYINQHHERTKFHFALERTLKLTKNAFEDYSDAEMSLRSEHALINPTTKAYVLSDNKEIIIDPEKSGSFQKAIRALQRKEVEVNVHEATEIHELKAMWIQQFLGTILNEDYEQPTAKAEKQLELN
jgi:hypothetical protein